MREREREAIPRSESCDYHVIRREEEEGKKRLESVGWQVNPKIFGHLRADELLRSLLTYTE